MNRRPRPRDASGILFIALMTAAGADGQTRSAAGAAGAGEVTITAGVVTADRFHRQGFSVDGPLERKTTISVDTTVNATSKLAIHVGTGWGAFYAASGGSPTGLRDSHHGRQDTTLGLTWRMDGRTPGRGPTGAVKIGGRLPGPYDAGYTNSLGDGATELQGSVAARELREQDRLDHRDRLPKTDARVREPGGDQRADHAPRARSMSRTRRSRSWEPTGGSTTE